MKFTTFLAALLCAFLSPLAADDHEVIEKVMKEGLKGDDSLCAKVVGGTATDEEIKTLAELVRTMKGTEAPKGDQAEYDSKVGALIAAIDAIHGGNKSPEAIEAWKKASNCKGCHSAHKP
jgi:hypothetical protein